MDLPFIEGYQIGQPIGSGLCGKVYLATRDDGTQCALKVLDTMAVNRRVLLYAIERARELPSPNGLLPIFDYNLDGTPYYIAMPLIEGEDEQLQPFTLESVCGSLDRDIAWHCIMEIAEPLGLLHKHGLVHCNLKPSNVFLIPRGEGHSILLTDYAQGLMGGVHHIDVSSLLPYASPEQIADPERVFEGAGLRWDVYSFGVLAYRVLTGAFPRGMPYLQALAVERSQATGGMPVTAESSDFLQTVHAQPQISWPDEPENEREERRRGVIERCLELEPASRWSDIREATREFQKIDHEMELAASEERARIARDRQQSHLFRTRVASAALLALFCLAAWFATAHYKEAKDTAQDLEDTERTYQASLGEKEGMIGELEQKVSGIEADHLIATSELAATQDSADQLFTQLLSSGTTDTEESEDGAQVLSDAQLEEALGHYEARLTSGDSLSEEEHFRTLLNIAQLQDKLSIFPQALDSYKLAHQAGERFLSRNPTDPKVLTYSRRLADSGMRFGDLLGDAGRPTQALAINERATVLYRRLLESGEVDPEAKLGLARSMLSLCRHRRSAGQLEGALEAAQEAGGVLGESDEALKHTDEQLLLLARVLHERGLTLRSLSRYDEGIGAQMSIVDRLLPSVDADSPTGDLAILLARAYTELGEMVAAHVQPKDAVVAHQQAARILGHLMKADPENRELAVLLSRNWGELARHDRDSGKLSVALQKQRDAIALLAEMPASAQATLGDEVPMRLALLRGHFADLLGESGKTKEGLVEAQAAVEILDSIVGPAENKGSPIPGITPHGLKAELAKVLGGMGHLKEKAGKKEDAILTFQRANDLWTALQNEGAGAAEVAYGIDWTRKRLEELQ